MKHVAWVFSWGLFILTCSIFTGKANADAFATVPAGSALYTQLASLQNSTWENDANGRTPRITKPAEQTRYEFAIEIAKSAIDFNAHRQADATWIATVPRIELRALRALMLEFSAELAGFSVDTQGITKSIDTVLRNPASDTSNSSNHLFNTQPATDQSLSLGNFQFSPSNNVTNPESPDTLNVPLSEQFAFYAKLTTPSNALLHAVPQETATTDTSRIETEANTSLSAGANMSINDWLNLRAGYIFNQNNQPQTLQTLLATSNNSWFATPGSTSSIGGGVDVKVSSKLSLSGGISRLSLNAANGLSDFSGTQFEGGVGIRGLDDRLLLSARLAHLLPDNAASLASNAARLNLDFALSNTFSLNLLYQQMFSLSPQQDNKSTFAGGLNIHF